jgi:hypothetical protein
MGPNENITDRIFRVIVGLIALYAGYSLAGGWIRTILYIVAAIGLITGITGFCLIYKIFGFSTRKDTAPKAEPNPPPQAE